MNQGLRSGRRHIGYNHYRVGTKTIAVEPRDVIQLSMGPQKLNN